MRRTKKYTKFIVSLAAVMLASLTCWSAYATSVLQMNLAELCYRADRIFTGTVVQVTPDTVRAGGGEIPVLRYRLRVNEAFKGRFEEEKGVAFAELVMLGSRQQLKSSNDALMPVLHEGQEYLLMVARTGPVGITSTIGLVQGLFTLSNGKEKMALNGADNVGLFDGMNAPSMPADGPVSYRQLADLIQQYMGGN